MYCCITNCKKNKLNIYDLFVVVPYIYTIKGEGRTAEGKRRKHSNIVKIMYVTRK